MNRKFDKNLFIMLLSIMVGTIIITYFIADIINRSKMEDLSEEITTELNIKHSEEIKYIYSNYNNFTDHFLKGFTKINSARELRSEGNYYFDLAYFWHNSYLNESDISYFDKCINNCVDAADNYLFSNQRFNESTPYLIISKNYTNDSSYIGLVNYCISFSESGKNITDLRYKASLILKNAIENYSLGDLENASILMENFNALGDIYEEQLLEYTRLETLIDNFVFFEEDRTKSGGLS